MVHAADVDTVLVDGEVVVHGGRLLRLDADRLATALAESARAAEPLRQRVAAMLPALRAHLAAVYRGWP
jgi:hypothetical protein